VAEKKKRILHASFEIGILLKGIHAVLEVVGGLLLLFVSPEFLRKTIEFLTKRELREDPKDWLANFMLHAGERYSVGAQHFGVNYLLSHGIVQIVLVFLLWRKKLWAYPLAVAALVAFIAYQTIRWTWTHSWFLIFLTVLDAAIIWLTIVEYRRIKSSVSSIDGILRHDR
jgi:uncharacterized membrane protein